jgi:hypothetical protein
MFGDLPILNFAKHDAPMVRIIFGTRLPYADSIPFLLTSLWLVSIFNVPKLLIANFLCWVFTTLR